MTDITPPLKELIASLRAVHAAGTDGLTKLGAIIRDLEWHAAQSVVTSNPLPSPKPEERERRKQSSAHANERRAEITARKKAALAKLAEDEPEPAQPIAPIEERSVFTATDKDYEPIVADFDQIQVWAFARGAKFDSWDDLPGINRRRERIGLPDFARKYPTKGVRG